MDALNREVRGWQADQELFDSTVMERAAITGPTGAASTSSAPAGR